MATTDDGELRAWRQLAARDAAAVRDRALAELLPGPAGYRLRCFGRPVEVDPARRRVRSPGAGGGPFLELLAPFFTLTVLWYLARAVAVPASGRLVRPAALPGGEIFARGTHVLPLDALAAAFARNPGGFLAAAAALGGTRVAHGDAAAELRPFPRVPVTVLLWAEDEEFPARADLLFDAGCTRQLPLDALWSTALITVQALLGPGRLPAAASFRTSDPPG